MSRRWRALLALGGLLLAARLGLTLVPLPPDLLDRGGHSVVLLDRTGRPLREAWSGQKGASRPVKLDQVSPWAVQATLAAEDGRYYRHWGVDPLAVARAARDNLAAGQVIAGGSTLTQQLVANRCGRSAGLPGKVLEALRALRLETLLSKEAILELYLNTVPFGNNTNGLESAARYYFGRPAQALSLAQAAFLAAIPRGPDLYDPLRHFERTRQRQAWVLQRMRALGMIEEEALQRALAEPIAVAPHPEAFAAPHYCERVLRQLPLEAAQVRTSLDLELQQQVEHIVRSRVADLAERGVNGAAVVVLDNASGEVRCWVGSPNFFDAAADGQVDLAGSPRQPGSALKPFTYGLALEHGMTAATLLMDLPVRYRTSTGEFAPTNYDETFHGPVRLRTALASSYNVPAVRVLHEIGVDTLLRRLHALGFASLEKPAEHYGLALTLGAGEVTLLELTRAFRCLARGGRWGEERLWRQLYDASGREMAVAPPDEREVFPPVVAALLLDILSDPAARAPAFGHDSTLTLPFPCAVKTGTSRAYRDNWTVGCTTRYTVGVWVGHTGGAPMHDVSGVTGAGPIFREVMLALHREAPVAFPPPTGMTRVAVCPTSGQPPGPYCPATIQEWLPQRPQPACPIHQRAGEVYPAEYTQWARERGIPSQSRELRITFPREGDVFVLDPTLDRRYQTLHLAASGEDAHWSVDGAPWSAEAEWRLRPGSHTARARDPGGAVATVRFSVR